MIRISLVKEAANVLVSRLIPGALNVITFLVLATWLSRESYGIASTYIATAAAATDLLLGPITHSALIHYSEHRARGEQKRYESVHVSNTILVSTIIGLTGLGLVWAGLVDWRIIAAVVAVGAYSSIQEIAHARLQFYRFAIGSSAQSVAFLLLAYAIVRPEPTVSNTLEAFAISYAIGAMTSVLLVRPKLAWPSPQMLKAAFGLGSIPTLSNFALNGLNLGCRYLLMLFGRNDTLGVFAFSLDIAQRAVGIFLNLATFALVPRALKNSENGDARQLWSMLARGWLGAVAVSLLGAATILAIAATQLVPSLNRPVYDPISFGLICLAVIVHRSSKMVLSPVAMRLRRTAVLLKPLFVIAPVALASVALTLYLEIPYGVELVYTLAYMGWAAVAYRSLKPQLQS